MRDEYHFLDFHFLERAETASARLHVQRALDVVPHAFVLILAVSNRSELLSGDLLEGFRTANIACVRIDQQQWLDLRDACDDASNSDEFPELCALYLANSHGDVGE